MKEAELRKRATCSRCAKLLGTSGSPVFAVLRQQDYIINLAAARRQTALEIAFGAAIALHLGPDDDMARPAVAEVDLTLCGLCRAALLKWLQNV